MRKFRKGLKLKTVCMAVGALFLLNSLLYASNLRVPMNDLERVEDFLTGDISLYRPSPNDLSPVKNGLLAYEYVMHDIAVKKAVNPNDDELVGVYAAAGVDVSNVFLSTNASRVYFIDYGYREASLDSLKAYWKEGRDAVKLFDSERTVRPGEPGYYIDKYRQGYDDQADIAGNIEQALIKELKAMGVKKEDIIDIDRDEDGNIRIRFKWAYFGKKSKTDRTIILINEDITNISDYLKEKLNGKLDFYYQRAGQKIPARYHLFITRVAGWLKDSGIMITDDHDNSDQYFSPRLDDFMLIKPTDEMKYWEEKVIELRKEFHIEVNFYGWCVSIRKRQKTTKGFPGKVTPDNKATLNMSL
ncbi:MAG: hypothetical protein ABH843_03740 [Candidatus Omnitrophota bacterium]